MGQIQLIALRPTKDLQKQHEAFVGNWAAPSLEDLFTNIDSYVSEIPSDQRWNFFYTIFNAKEGQKREFESQSAFAFDIDGISKDRIEEYYTPISEAIGLKFGTYTLIATGNGLHIIIMTKNTWNDIAYFQKNKEAYKHMCFQINEQLSGRNLPGKADPSIFDKARLLRLPNTRNIKTPETGYPNKNSTGDCYLLALGLQQHDWDLTKANIALRESFDYTTFRRHNMPDTLFVQEQCPFLLHCKLDQAEVTEENWYKMLSIVSRLGANETESIELCHTYSEKHPNYSQEETDRKIQQALRSSGPRTCRNIAGSYSGCQNCPHLASGLTSPICLQGPNYIKTRATQFRTIGFTLDGKKKPSAPVYEDLRKYFYQNYHVLTHDGILHLWRINKWEEVPGKQKNIGLLRTFVESNLSNPKDNEKNEFTSRVLDDPAIQVSVDFFSKHNAELVNCNNGIVDFRKDEIRVLPHDPNFGFSYITPFDFDPAATCPRFDRFMQEIFLENQPLIDFVMEFFGYAISGSSNAKWPISLMFYGEGANGKSTLERVLKNMLPKEVITYVPMSAFQCDKAIYDMVMYSLVNLTGETAGKALQDTANFKTITSGEDITVRRLYNQSVSATPKCKIITSCNTLPKTYDNSNGMKRRLKIVPFDRTFDLEEQDTALETTLAGETAGIFNRCIEAYLRLRKRGQFIVPELCEEHTRQHINENDNMLDFIDNYILVDETCEGANSEDLRQAWALYCKSVGIQNWCTTSQKFGNEFGKKLKGYLKDNFKIKNYESIRKSKWDNSKGYCLKVRTYPKIKLIKQDF